MPFAAARVVPARTPAAYLARPSFSTGFLRASLLGRVHHIRKPFVVNQLGRMRFPSSATGDTVMKVRLCVAVAVGWLCGSAPLAIAAEGKEGKVSDADRKFMVDVAQANL